jgi:hypothetical protein
LSFFGNFHIKQRLATGVNFWVKTKHEAEQRAQERISNLTPAGPGIFFFPPPDNYSPRCDGSLIEDEHFSIFITAEPRREEEVREM